MTTPTPRIEYTIGHEDPPQGLTWLDDAGDVIDLTGHTFTLRIGTPGRPADHTKTSGITGAAAAPNVVIEWSTDELDGLDAGTHRGQLTATSDDRDRGPMPLTIEVRPAIT